MTRIYPSRIRDTVRLSELLDLLLQTLENSPLHTGSRALSYDSRIPEPVLRRLQQFHRRPETDPEVRAEDYHVLFANILFRYPTVRLYRQRNGRIYFRM
ncbi:MAG: hypothetical protein EP344_02705 [Bacteroidetes bacterium]|nr:MAG: hypothetical protein EP344_02705 [Bacteroidota bacterium]